MDALDISVCEGDVVGVIVEKDPMGNKERWFVDNGGKMFSDTTCSVIV